MRNMRFHGLTALLISVMLTLSLTGCSGLKKEVAESVPKKPVKVIEIKESQTVEELEYIGIAKPEQMKNLSFKASGKIASIPVEKGQKIKKGDILAELDIIDLSLAADAARAARDSAAAQYQKALNGATEEDIALAASNVTKAQKAFEFAKDSLDKVKNLYKSGAASKQDLDNAELEYELANQQYISAKTILQQTQKGARQEDKEALKAQLEQAETDLRFKENALKEATLRADIGGYVVEILSEEGELVSAGYPVVIIGSLSNVVSFGLTQEDAVNVNIGDSVRVKAEGKIYTGKIKSIAKTIDMETRTYSTDVLIDDGHFSAGSVLKVYVPKEQYNAIMIPLTSILRGNYDYVYIIDNGVARKKQVQLGKLHGDMVEVTGLNPGDKLVTEGMKSINDGEEVEIIQ